MTTSHSFRFATFAAAALLAACFSDPIAPTQPVPAGVSAVLEETSLPSSALLASSAAGVPVMTSLSAPLPSNCSYDAASGGYTCASISFGGMTFTRGFTLFDAVGNTQRDYDRNTTAAIRAVMTAVGTITSAASTFNVDERQTSTVSGLLTGIHTVNSISVSTVKGTIAIDPTSTTSVSTAQTFTMTDVVLPSGAAGASPYPASGVITMVGQTTFGTLPATESRFQITFNGTSSVPVTITVGGVTRQCTLDLSGRLGMVCA
jgi:hypothetical protein